MNAFKTSVSLEARCAESKRITTNYPDRIPVVCEARAPITLDKTKYLVPKTMTLADFLYVVRKRIKCESNEALFLYINNKLPILQQTLTEAYERERDADGFLYFVVSKESTFG
jgi:GABA(A) receptor-associated protein